MEETKPLTEKEQKQALFDRQKEMLDTFLSTGALTAAQYQKSLSGLREKMFPEETPSDDPKQKNEKPKGEQS